jgi:pilus assembly protein FimV
MELSRQCLGELEINIMSRRLSRISLVLVLLLSSKVWALGLGDIRMESALNEPLSARIELLSAAPEELDDLTIAMASADTFERYGIDRPFYLQDVQFTIVRSGRADGNYVQVRSLSPMAEPFLTFLVEASWSRGRLLREYTVFLDPPTFAPPQADTAPAVQAPTRTAPSDSGRIERSTPPPAQQRPTQRAPAPAPRQPEPEPVAGEPREPALQPSTDPSQFNLSVGSDYLVERGETLWGLASRVRPDSRVTINQTMLAIFEANPEAFGGNINILRAGAQLRIPTADSIFQINRADAFAEAQRQNAEWSGGTVPVVADTETRPSLTLVPPDDDFVDDSDTLAPEPEPEPVTETGSPREQEILDRIAELEAADVPQQQSLIEIRDNELAQLREELARIRGEVDEPVVDDPFADDADADLADDTDTDLVADDALDDETVVDDTTADATPTETTAPTEIISSSVPSEPGLVDRALEFVKSFWMIIVGVVVLVGALLFWMMRRGGDEEDPEDWQPLDRDEMAADISATESMRAPAMDESIVVVEQEPEFGGLDDTFDAPAPDFAVDATEEVPAAPVEPPAATGETGQVASLEDTFSSETAINLDQSDPIAEADFHMAYGLYDQAADLINGALSLEPERADLLTKLCEIYFVWGNRDAFVDAAGRLKSAVGDGDSADWDKIVIMGQQIASDDALFAGASAAGATKAVDLSLGDDGGDDTGALDMEFGEDADAVDIVDLGGGSDDEILDLGAADESHAVEEESVVDFVLDETSEEAALGDEDQTFLADVDETAESPTVESAGMEITSEMPAADATAELPEADETVAAPSDETAETPTIEHQFDVLSGTSELPSLDDTLGDAIPSGGQSADETAEINLDDLGLDVDSMAETELASLDDMDDLEATGRMEALTDTGIHDVIDDPASVTGRNLEVDPDATGLQEALGADEEDTGINESLSATGLGEELDESLLDATGVTQVLSADLAVETTTDAEADAAEEDATMLATTLGAEPLGESLPDDAETLLASLDDDEADDSDFDFAKTEALPKDAFTGDFAMDETGEMPAVASTDVELDLDDLTAALQVSEAGDTVEQPRDDATVEYPRPAIEEEAGTVSIAPDEMSDDLSDARTMTEVGTKLDLARAYVDMGDPAGARSILEEVLDEGDEGQRQQAQQLLDSLPS